MEFDFLGDRCSLPDCRRHDYLPLTCSKCDKVFCSEHGTAESHRCSSIYKNPSSATSSSGTNSNITTIATRVVPVPCKGCGHVVTHVAANASAAARAAALGSHKPNCTLSRKNAPVCAAPDCKQRLSVPITCKDCDLSFCVRHRSAARHGCVPLDNNSRQERKGGPVAAGPSRTATTTTISTAKKKNNNSPIHPYGDDTIEGHNRVYCQLTLNTTTSSATSSGSNVDVIDVDSPVYYFFFSKRWTVGRALDMISQRMQMPIRSRDGRRLQLRVGSDVKGTLDKMGEAVPQHGTVCVEYEATVCGRQVVNPALSSSSPIVSIDLTREC